MLRIQEQFPTKYQENLVCIFNEKKNTAFLWLYNIVFGIISGWIEYSIYIFKKIILLCNVHDNPTKDKKI